MTRFKAYIAATIYSLLCLWGMMPDAFAANSSTHITCNKTAYAPGPVLQAAQAITTLTCPGVNLGDWVLVSAVQDLLGLKADAYVSAPNTITIILTNTTGASVTLPSGTLSVAVWPRYVSP